MYIVSLFELQGTLPLHIQFLFIQTYQFTILIELMQIKIVFCPDEIYPKYLNQTINMQNDLEKKYNFFSY